MEIYIIVLGFILFDIITGIMKALYKGNFNSTLMREGGFHKLSEAIAVVLAVMLQYACDYINLGTSLPLVNVVSVYICVMELVSILENICEVNPALNELFRPYLDKLKGGNNGN